MISSHACSFKNTCRCRFLAPQNSPAIARTTMNQTIGSAACLHLLHLLGRHVFCAHGTKLLRCYLPQHYVTSQGLILSQVETAHRRVFSSGGHQHARRWPDSADFCLVVCFASLEPEAFTVRVNYRHCTLMHFDPDPITTHCLASCASIASASPRPSPSSPSHAPASAGMHEENQCRATGPLLG